MGMFDPVRDMLPLFRAASKGKAETSVLGSAIINFLLSVSLSLCLSQLSLSGSFWMRPAFGCLERPLANFFHFYGGFVSRHPFPFIAFPLLLTAYLSTGKYCPRLGGQAAQLDTSDKYTQCQGRGREAMKLARLNGIPLRF